MKEVVEQLENLNKTISVMESCTGGAVTSAITNIPGSSNVIQFGAVTYANEFKIKMGVEQDLIDKYSVYSIEVAKDMSKKITMYSHSDYGVGVTGKLRKADEANPYGNDDLVYVSIYDKTHDIYRTATLSVTKEKREENKDMIVHVVCDLLKRFLFDNQERI